MNDMRNSITDVKKQPKGLDKVTIEIRADNSSRDDNIKKGYDILKAKREIPFQIFRAFESSDKFTKNLDSYKNYMGEIRADLNSSSSNLDNSKSYADFLSFLYNDAELKYSEVNNYRSLDQSEYIKAYQFDYSSEIFKKIGNHKKIIIKTMVNSGLIKFDSDKQKKQLLESLSLLVNNDIKEISSSNIKPSIAHYSPKKELKSKNYSEFKEEQKINPIKDNKNSSKKRSDSQDSILYLKIKEFTDAVGWKIERDIAEYYVNNNEKVKDCLGNYYQDYYYGKSSLEIYIDLDSKIINLEYQYIDSPQYILNKLESLGFTTKTHSLHNEDNTQINFKTKHIGGLQLKSGAILRVQKKPKTNDLIDFN